MSEVGQEKRIDDQRIVAGDFFSERNVRKGGVEGVLNLTER